MLLMKRGNLGFMIKIGNLLSKTGIYALVWRTIARGDENGETPAQVLVNVLLNYGMYPVNRTILKSYWKKPIGDYVLEQGMTSLKHHTSSIRWPQYR